jgi:cytidine deaminase
MATSHEEASVFPHAAMTERELIEVARAVRAQAYAPYSRFKVGAAVKSGDGQAFWGVNIENASYSLSCCAERVAVYNAVAHGCRDIVQVVVVGPGPDLVPPCGACRQVLAEFGNPEVVLASPDPTVDPVRFQLADLLPHHFGPSWLLGREGLDAPARMHPDHRNQGGS